MMAQFNQHRFRVERPDHPHLVLQPLNSGFFRMPEDILAVFGLKPGPAPSVYKNDDTE